MGKGRSNHSAPTAAEIPRETSSDVSWDPCILRHPEGWDAVRNIAKGSSHHKLPLAVSGRAHHRDGYY